MPVTAAIIPAAPMLLPAASAAQPETIAGQVSQLRESITAALAALAAADTALLLVSGPESLVSDASVASLAAYGLPHVSAELQIDAELLAAISARGQAPRERSDRLDGDLSVLGLWIASERPEMSVAPVTIPARASASGLSNIAAGITAARAAIDRSVVVVAAGDLAATLQTSSPGYLVEGATEWDAAAVAAIEAGDLEAFGQLGPDEAARVQARGWAPIALAMMLAEPDTRPSSVTYLAPRGVGQLVAS